jgi:hypothetical protein
MCEKRKVFMQERYFLNEYIEQPAIIIAKVEVVTYNKDLAELDLYPSSSIILQISDCSRSINLDFDIGEDEGEHSIRKITRIIDTLTNFKNALIIANEEVIKGQLKRKELEEKSDKQV